MVVAALLLQCIIMGPFTDILSSCRLPNSFSNSTSHGLKFRFNATPTYHWLFHFFKLPGYPHIFAIARCWMPILYGAKPISISVDFSGLLFFTFLKSRLIPGVPLRFFIIRQKSKCFRIMLLFYGGIRDLCLDIYHFLGRVTKIEVIVCMFISCLTFFRKEYAFWYEH